MIQVRPLRRWRCSGGSRLVAAACGSGPVRYGDHSYLTYDRDFFIFMSGGIWHIHTWTVRPGVLQYVEMSGVLETHFPTRRAAIEALEHVIATIDD